MQHNEHILASAYALLHPCGSLTPPVMQKTWQSAFRPDDSYKVALSTEQVQAMDETIGGVRG